ncbi:MAG: sodium:alanine symporter family protein [Alphaproteobacteria bacterium]|nr:sodium:alanine symporter family protein [Alphaproteobacteria bacterium]
MEIITKVNDFINGIVWGVPLMLLIVATGVYFTIRLKFFQFAHPIYIFKETIVKAFRKKDEKKPSPGELTSFQAAMTSVSAIVGSGNVAGVASAIMLGGPGVLFWMIVIAFFSMVTKFAEITLGIKYREVKEDGTVFGGTMYYLSKGLGHKWIGILFSILVIPFAFVISGVVDTNTIALTLYDSFDIPTIVTGVVLAVAVGIIIFGGIKRVGWVCAVVAPFMGGLYILAGLFIIIIHITEVPAAITTIVKSAFTPGAVTGGLIGSIFAVMKNGMARGIYSNEAGLGTAAMIHYPAKVKHPVEQGLWGPMEVFLDTVLVCTISGLAIVLSGLWSTGELDGASLTVSAFERLLPGKIGMYIAIASVVLFGFSCLISYYTYAITAAEFLFGKKSQVVIKLCWIAFVIIGSQTTLGFAWNLADTINGLMIIPNLIGVLLLSNEVVKLKDEYFAEKMQSSNSRFKKKS